MVFFFFSSRRRHTRWTGDWSSDVCSSDLSPPKPRRPSSIDLRRCSPTGTSPARQRFRPSTDRKSTRLNSSHPSISYAVFCLKKKKKNANIIILSKQKVKDNRG